MPCHWQPDKERLSSMAEESALPSQSELEELRSWHKNLLHLLSKAFDKLGLEWSLQVESIHSRLDEWFLQLGHHHRATSQRSAPFFLAVHKELTKSCIEFVPCFYNVGRHCLLGVWQWTWTRMTRTRSISVASDKDDNAVYRPHNGESHFLWLLYVAKFERLWKLWEKAVLLDAPVNVISDYSRIYRDSQQQKNSSNVAFSTKETQLDPSPDSIRLFVFSPPSKGIC